jgi:formate hydrogenlyase subunit 4
MRFAPLVHMLLAFVLAPLLFGIINRTKAFFAGRRGQPLLQIYYDVWKLLRKGAVYSRTTTWVFRAGPIVGLAVVVMVITLVPFGNAPALVAFPGDLVLFAYLFGLMRFFTVIAALDTGSSFEGMGASREVQFSALAEPVLFLGLAATACRMRSISLSGMLEKISPDTWHVAGLALALVTAALFVVLLCENARIPVDDPNTHLELTMIHEVMVLDHGGPDLAFILYGTALKLWALGAVLIGVVVPIHSGNAWLDGAAALGGMLGLAVVIGIVESTMARLRLVRVPQLLVGAGVFAALALMLVLR